MQLLLSWISNKEVMFTFSTNTVVAEEEPLRYLWNGKLWKMSADSIQTLSYKPWPNDYNI